MNAIDLRKSFEFFNPNECTSPIHVIGVGATGSILGWALAKLGVTDVHLYDFDIVEPKNIANQQFRHKDIGKFKVDAMKEIMCEINPALEETLQIHNEAFEPGTVINGYVFLCVDNIDLRREITEHLQYNPYVRAVFDFRIGLTDAQHYCAKWDDPVEIERFLGTMQFTHEEANLETPVSACNEMLSIIPTNMTIVAYGVANFINLVRGEIPHKKIMLNLSPFYCTGDFF